MIKPDISMEFDTEIIDYTSDGRGVCRVNSYPIFVPYTAVGDKLRVIVTKNKKSYFEGSILEIYEQSNKRETPSCEHFGKCGGCDILHIGYEHQLQFKKDTVKKALTKIAKNDSIIVNNVIKMADNTHYRNKAVFNFQEINGKIIAGFYQKKSKEIVEPTGCKIINKNIDTIRELVQNFCNDVSYLPLRLAVKHSFETNEIMVCLVIKDKKFPFAKEFIDLLKPIDDVKSIIINYADKNTVNFGKKSDTIYGKDYIIEKIGNLTFKNYLTSFFQVNPTQTIKLYNKAIDLLELNKSDTLIDLYCGVGTISLICADSVKDTLGIEVVDYAVKSAKENAIDNNINNSQFILADADKLLKYANNVDNLKIVVDPPRKGLDKTVIESIATLKPTCIAYISCDEGTLARDLKIFEELGYVAKEVTPVDMFCGSFHIETVTLLYNAN